MSNRLSYVYQHIDDYELLINVDLMEVIHHNTFLATLVWLSLGYFA
jgi:hypothetical protein